MSGAGGVGLARERLADARGSKIALVPHCLLNQNARYLGGASASGARAEPVDRLMEDGLGIVQMPCPEIRAWGGPLKWMIWLPYGRGRAAAFLSKLVFPFFMIMTKLSFGRTARNVAREAARWEKAGRRVVELHCVDGSPSCGATTTLDMKKCLALHAEPATALLDRRGYNEHLYNTCAVAGRGLFTAVLVKALAMRGIAPRPVGHDLARELGADRI